MNLDIRTFPFHQTGKDGLDLAECIQQSRPILEQMTALGLIGPASKGSFGFAMADPFAAMSPDGYQHLYQDPHKLVWLVGGWGPDRDRYIANAIRKMRAAARTGLDTLLLATQEQPEAVFENFSSQSSATARYEEEYGFGGATFGYYRGRCLLFSVSTYPQEHDPVASLLVGSVIAAHLL